MAESDSESSSSTSSSSTSDSSSGEESARKTGGGKNVVDTIKTSVSTNEETKRDEPLKDSVNDSTVKPRNKTNDKKKNVSSSESSSSETDSSDSSDSDESSSSVSGDDREIKKSSQPTSNKKQEFSKPDLRKSATANADIQQRKNSENDVERSFKERSDEDAFRKEYRTNYVSTTERTLKSPERDSRRSSKKISEIRGEIFQKSDDSDDKHEKNRRESDGENENVERMTYKAASCKRQEKDESEEHQTKYINVSTEKTHRSPERDSGRISNKISETPLETSQKSDDSDKLEKYREGSDGEKSDIKARDSNEKNTSKATSCKKQEKDKREPQKSPGKEMEIQESKRSQDPTDNNKESDDGKGNGEGVLKTNETDIGKIQKSPGTDSGETSKETLDQSINSSDSADNAESHKSTSKKENASPGNVINLKGESDSFPSTTTEAIAQKSLKYDREEGELPEEQIQQYTKKDQYSEDSAESKRSQHVTQSSRSPSKERKQKLASVLLKPKRSSRSQSRSREPQRTLRSVTDSRSRSRDVEHKQRSGSRKRSYSGEGRLVVSRSKSRSQSRSKETQRDRRSKSRSRSRSRQTHRKQRSNSRSPRRSHSREKRVERKYEDHGRSHSTEHDKRRSRRSESLERRREERKRRHAERDEKDKSKRSKRGDENIRTRKNSEDNSNNVNAVKDKNNDNVTVTDPKAKITERQRKTVDILTSRTGGAYIPPAKLRLMQAKITDKASAAYQRIAWEALKKSIHGYINKVNVDNIAIITRELLKENIVRGRGLLCRSIIQAQAASPTFTHVYAALVSIINSKFPNIGELLLKRLVIQFKRAFRRNDKGVCLSASRFVAHLVNQRVAHEILALEILTLLVESPTDDSVEVAIAFLKECGMKLTEVSSKGIGAIFEMLKNILHEGKLDKRVQYMIEVVFQVRKDGFKDHQSVIESLELVEEDDQFTHLLMLDDATNPEDILNAFKFDEEYAVNEDKYKGLSKEILGSDGSDSGDSSGSGSDSDSDASDDDKGEDDEKAVAGDIIDSTETNLIALRRTIYLTINSSLDYEECAHKLMKMQLKPGQEIELCHMFLDCCAEQRTYEKFYGLLAQRFCLINKSYIEPFEEIFCDTYGTTHRLDTNRLRNVSKFFAHLLFTDAISWDVMECIRLNEDDTTSSSRIFIKILFQELAEYMGLSQLNKKLKDEVLTDSLTGLFPKDNPRNTRFSINFFTSIGLGGLTDELRQFLKNAPKSVPAINAEILANKPINVSASSASSKSSSSSSSSDSSSESTASSDSEEEKRKRKRKKQKTKKKTSSKKKSKKSEKKSKKSNKKQKKSKKVETSEEDSKSSSSGSDSDSESSQSSTSSDSGNDKRKSKKKNKSKQNKKSKRSDSSDDQVQIESKNRSKRRKIVNKNDDFVVQRDNRRNRSESMRSERDTRKAAPPQPPQRRESEIERRREEREKRHREKRQERDRKRTHSRSRSRDRRGGGDDRYRREGRSDKNREPDRDYNRRRYRNDDQKSRSRSRDRHEKRERDYERSRPRNTSKERG